MNATAKKLKISNYQAWLFPEMVAPHIPDQDLQKSGKRTIDRLLKVRREMVAGEEAFIPSVNFAVERIRELSRLSDTQREELILWSVEKSMATSIGEISEDTKIDAASVKEMVNNLVKRNILYYANRLIPGSGRQYYLIKSNRVKTPEAV